MSITKKSNTIKTIAIDAMGGDHGLSVVVPAVLDVLKHNKDISVILVGDQVKIESYLEHHRVHCNSQITVHHASQIVEMDDKPAVALRNKKDSSMRVAINLVKEKQAQACVSAGNTGALMAIARFVLKMVPGIDRPAICTILPTTKSHFHMLDLGANVDCDVEHLFQFSLMGSVLSSAVSRIDSPRVALLNIGEEATKGNEQIKAASQLLSETKHVNYIGFVEGDDIYQGAADVVVCDGFIGNIALKTSEGMAKMIAYSLKENFTKSFFHKLVGFLIKPIMSAMGKRLDPRKYNGATLLGLKGIVIKSHGSADRIAFANAIEEAIKEIDKNIPELIYSRMSSIMQENGVF